MPNIDSGVCSEICAVGLAQSELCSQYGREAPPAGGSNLIQSLQKAASYCGALWEEKLAADSSNFTRSTLGSDSKPTDKEEQDQEYDNSRLFDGYSHNLRTGDRRKTLRLISGWSVGDRGLGVVVQTDDRQVIHAGQHARGMCGDPCR